MHATLRQLETLRAFLLTRSVTETARMTHVSQPAVSQTLKDLEVQFGFAIYSRVGNRVVLTSEVLQVMPEIERLLMTFSNLQGRVMELRDSRAGSLSIVSGPTPSIDLLPRAIASFRQQRPNVRVHMHVSTEVDMAKKVRDEIFDLGTGFYPSTESSIATQPLLETELICVMRKDHPLAVHKHIDLRQLVGHTVAVVEHHIGATLNMQRILHDALANQSLITTNQSISALSLVQHGGAVAVLHPLTVPEAMFDSFHLARFEPQEPIAFALFYSRRRPLPRITSRFMVAIRDSARVKASMFEALGIPFTVTM
jgi:Transcriptional regulator